jgi:hypothetical protein
MPFSVEPKYLYCRGCQQQKMLAKNWSHTVLLYFLHAIFGTFLTNPPESTEFLQKLSLPDVAFKFWSGNLYSHFVRLLSRPNWDDFWPVGTSAWRNVVTFHSPIFDASYNLGCTGYAYNFRSLVNVVRPCGQCWHSGMSSDLKYHFAPLIGPD